MHFNYAVQGYVNNDDPDEHPTIFAILVNVETEKAYSVSVQNTKTKESLLWTDFTSKYPRNSLEVDVAYCIEDSLEDYERFNQP